MTEGRARQENQLEAGWYEIRLQGRLETRWARWFEAVSLSTDSDGTTVLRGQATDQAALHGLLQKARDLGLPLVSVTYRDPRGNPT